MNKQERCCFALLKASILAGQFAKIPLFATFSNSTLPTYHVLWINMQEIWSFPSKCNIHAKHMKTISNM